MDRVVMVVVVSVEESIFARGNSAFLGHFRCERKCRATSARAWDSCGADDLLVLKKPRDNSISWI
jgi:hypothetical protein